MTETNITSTQSLRRTPLYAAHVNLGARLVPFAGYEMPVQYPTGILAEHAWTRDHASLFDISHMGQAILISGDGRHETVAAALESLVPSDILGLQPGQQRYTQLLNDHGGIIDDLMVTRSRDSKDGGSLFLVLNASRKDIDYAVIAKRLGKGIRLEPKTDRALLALQGPKAAGLLALTCHQSSKLGFMQATCTQIAGIDCDISRSGYTGEDGYEISVAAIDAERLWHILLHATDLRPCGLGARDSLRLEAGLCLYGHELDEKTSPIEAGLAWSIQKRRRLGGGFPGAARIQSELANGVSRIRVGILPEGRAPARDGTEIQSSSTEKIGVVTSGGYSPTLKRPIAMGYVEKEHAQPGGQVKLIVRGSALDAQIVTLPFVPHSYHRLS